MLQSAPAGYLLPHKKSCRLVRNYDRPAVCYESYVCTMVEPGAVETAVETSVLTSVEVTTLVTLLPA